MHLHLLASILALTYVLYYVVIKFLLKIFTLQEILVNVYILSALMVLIVFNKELYTSAKKFDKQYLLLVFLAVIMVTSNGFGILGCSTKINFGVIDSLASAIYLIAVALISYYYFNDDLTVTNFIGILFIAFGAYLLT